jgi:hypothetical protein
VGECEEMGKFRPCLSTNTKFSHILPHSTTLFTSFKYIYIYQIINFLWACLAMTRLDQPKIPKKFSKSTPTFLLFISHQSLFITIQIKKLLQNKKKFIFLYKTFLLFSSHQLNLLQYQSTFSSPVHYQTQPIIFYLLFITI